MNDPYGRYYVNPKGRHTYIAGIGIENVAKRLDIKPPKTKKEKEIEAESKVRKRIQLRIKELKNLGFPKEEALIRINAEFSNTGFSGYFESWVENWYRKEKDYIERKSKVIEEIEGDCK